jgi:uncharacterized protein (TIGR00251 family)
MIPTNFLDRLKAEKRLIINVKAIPKSSKDEVVGVLDDGTLKVKVTAAPEKGRANAAICELLAAEFGVTRGNVEVLRGETSSRKQVLILL